MKSVLKGLIKGYELDIDLSVLSSQEKKYVEFIRNSKDNSGEYPSEALLYKQFPELHFTEEDDLSESDTRVHLANLIKSRKNLEQSKQLIQLAAKVKDTGLTSSMLGDLIVEEDSVEYEDTLASPISFKKYYDAKKDKPEGIVTNVKAIDDKIGGIPYGTLLTIGGFTSHGKSLWANNIVYHNVINLKYNAVILSLEVPKEQVFANLLVRFSKEDMWKGKPKFKAHDIERGKLTPEQEDFVFNELIPEFCNYQNHGKIIIYDESDIRDTEISTLKSLIVKADDQCRQDTGYPLDVFLVDHIQLVKFGGKSSKSDMEKINEAVSVFHKLALNFRLVDGEVQQLVGILLSQIGRDAFKKAKKKNGEYDTTALADANELERSSQVICTVYMDESSKMSNEAYVCLLKNRSGETFSTPEAVSCFPAEYMFGGSEGNFAESITDMSNDLEDVFGGGNLDELFG